jgi:hypothetical protein
MGRPSTTAPENDDTAARVGPAPARVHNAQRASSGQSITIAVPLETIGSLTVTAPAPALVSPDVGAGHVGCTRAALVEHLSWMAAHPRWRDRVIVRSRKRRLASPADVVASMRERYAAATGAPADVASPAVDELAAEQAALEAELGFVDAPQVAADDRQRRVPRRRAAAANQEAAPSAPHRRLTEASDTSTVPNRWPAPSSRAGDQKEGQ